MCCGAGALMCWSAGALCMCAGVRVCTRVRGCAGVQMYVCARARVCACAGVCVCGCAPRVCWCAGVLVSLGVLFVQVSFVILLRVFVCCGRRALLYSPLAETRLTVYRQRQVKSNTGADRASWSSAALSDNR